MARKEYSLRLRHFVCAVVALTLFPSSTPIATAAEYKPNAVIHAKRSAKSQVLVKSPTGSVSSTARKGFWLQVEYQGKKGWVKRNQISTDTTASGSLGLATGRLGSNSIVNTSGTRGLDAGDLKQSKPNAEALKTLRQYHVSKEQAVAFRTSSGLQERTLEYLKAPVQAGQQNEEENDR